MFKFRVLSPEEAVTLLRLAEEHHKSGRELPPEIIEKKREIEAATKNAELFIACFRVVDHSMVDNVVQLKLQLDALYGAWATRETTKPTVH
jgi:hypothetical protein